MSLGSNVNFNRGEASFLGHEPNSLYLADPINYFSLRHLEITRELGQEVKLKETVKR